MPRSSRAAAPLAALCALSLVACGSGQESKKTTATTPKPAAPKPSAPEVKVRVLAPNPSKALTRTVQVKVGDTVQFFVRPGKAKTESTARILVPTAAGRSLTVRARSEVGAQVSDEASATFKVAGGKRAQLTLVRWICYAPPTPSFCPLDASEGPNGLKLVAPSSRQDQPVLVVAQVTAPK